MTEKNRLAMLGNTNGRGNKGRVISKEWKQKLSLAKLGKKQSKEHIERRASKLRGSNNPLWKGDKVGYRARGL